MKRLYKSKTDKMIEGVCGGIASYLNIDPTIVRIIWAFVTVFSAAVPGILIYIICAVVIPNEPDAYDTTASYHENDR